MAEQTEGRDNDSRRLLIRLRDTLAKPVSGQDRLNRITQHIADSMGTDVCSIYLFRDAQTLELCATEGLRPDAVHQTRLRLGEGLVGRVARSGKPINTANAPDEPGYLYLPETGEEIYPSFLGVPIQHSGKRRGVLVVQSRNPHRFTEDQVYGLEIVAMVLAEMGELGAFHGDDGTLPRAPRFPLSLQGTSVQEGVAIGHVWLHEPRLPVANPVADDPDHEKLRLNEAIARLQRHVDHLIDASDAKGAHAEILEAYRMFTRSRGWLRRMEEAIDLGLSAEAAAEREHAETRARLEMATDPYLRDRLHDMDDLFHRLLRQLAGDGHDQTTGQMPDDAVLIARNIGPGELLDYGRRIKAVVLEEGSVGSHAAIVARSLSIPLIVHAGRITAEAATGDPIIVDGDIGAVHLRPEARLSAAFAEKLAMQAEAQTRYAGLRDLPATALCGTRVTLMMNAGLMADLPSMRSSGAEGVGLFRTELQFLTRRTVPKRSDLTRLYRHILDSAEGRPVMFRTLDIGSDKVLPYLRPQDEPNPAMGWRAIRVGLDRPAILKMQLQALIRAAAGRKLHVMFPFIAEIGEFEAAHRTLMEQIARIRDFGHAMPSDIRVGAMLETPAIAFAPRRFFRMCDFVAIGGNDLRQFFFAADRENERVRRRYDMLDSSFLALISHIVARCDEARVPLSFCGEDAGRLVEAAALAALGITRLSMRPTSISPVKELIRRTDLKALHARIRAAQEADIANLRPIVSDFLGLSNLGQPA